MTSRVQRLVRVSSPRASPCGLEKHGRDANLLVALKDGCLTGPDGFRRRVKRRSDRREDRQGWNRQPRAAADVHLRRVLPADPSERLSRGRSGVRFEWRTWGQSSRSVQSEWDGSVAHLRLAGQRSNPTSCRSSVPSIALHERRSIQGESESRWPRAILDSRRNPSVGKSASARAPQTAASHLFSALPTGSHDPDTFPRLFLDRPTIRSASRRRPARAHRRGARSRSRRRGPSSRRRGRRNRTRRGPSRRKGS